MRIKKLELIGFKSFKDKTVIQFDAGITGIVGPNGCGKSNIVDALMWVMGEMSAKHLRGSSMEDVIFAGSDGHAPAGMSEVSMVLENDGGPFPAKYLNHSEVMITRRLHRSGESEYLINKQQARLRDIQEIFMDTGAGSKGFSIIEQGAIGKIITAKPEDRKSLIEEAAGITKFKARKRESQRKLQSTDQNLLRLNDIVVELKRQLDSLHRQAQRAERYKKLKDEAQDLDLWLSSREYLELEVTLNEAQKAFEDAQAIEIQSGTDFDQLQSQVETLKTTLSEKENQVTDQQVKHASLQDQVKELDRLVTELKYKIEQGVKSEEMTGSILAENQKRQEILVKEKEELDAQFAEAEENADEIVKEYEQKRTELQTLELSLNEVETELSEGRDQLMRVSQELTSTETKTSSLEEQSEDMVARVANQKGVLDELVEKKTEFEKRKNKLVNELEKEKQLHFDLARDVESIEENKKVLTQKMEEKRTEVDEYKDRLNEVTSRLYGLENLHSNFEGFQEGVKNVMLWQKQNAEMHADGRVSQVSHFQPVADVVEVQPGYEIAMEASLGPKLQMLLGEKSDQAVQAVDYLKTQNTGRSSFLAEDLTDKNSSSAQTPGGDGVVSLLKNVVNVPEKYQSQVSFILDDVVVVDSIQTALRLRPEYPGWNFVTQEGDLLTEDGILTGGAEESADSGVLKRKAEIKELSARKDEWAGKLSLAQVALKKIESQFENLSQDLEKSKEESTRKEIALAELKKDLERAENEFQSVDSALQKQAQETHQAEEQYEKFKTDIRDLNEKREALKTEREQLETRIEELQIELLQRRDGNIQLKEEVTQLQVSSAAKSEQLEGLRRQRDRLAMSLAEVEEQLDKMSNESTKNTQALSENQVMIEEKRVELEKGISEIEDSEKKLIEYKNQYEFSLAEVRNIESQINESMKAKNDQQARMNEAQLKLDKASMKLQYLVEQTEERYMVDLPSVAPKYKEREGDISEAKTRLEELKGKLSRIGEVNLSAIEEFGELEERYEFLSKQQQDLVEAKEQLRKVIDRINRICSKRFKETFEAVNERFQKVFPVLFGGGESRLILVEDEEKGEMGIDIVAKPPGKKMTNVSLMSGGEKALTAVSLIFSIFLVKPSPYCLLDEVDAPLDDANVSRFNDLVKEMAKRSQIIIVTHNKYTMAVNKKLYGVTMEEKGVSKMVSVSLEEAEKVAEV